jgi:hypothetical protein
VVPDFMLLELLEDSTDGRDTTKTPIWKLILMNYPQVKSCKLFGMVSNEIILGIPVFVRRLTAEEVKEENELPKDTLLDKGKEVIKKLHF